MADVKYNEFDRMLRNQQMDRIAQAKEEQAAADEEKTAHTRRTGKKTKHHKIRMIRIENEGAHHRNN